MSFGFGIGDFLAAFRLASDVRQKWVDAPREYAAIRNEIKNLDSTLRDLHDLSIRVDITQLQRDSLATVSSSCLSSLNRADEIVAKYSVTSGSSSSRARRIWKRLKADPEDVRHVRDQLASIVTQLNTCQNNIEIHMIQDINDDIQDLNLGQEEEKKLKVADWFAPISFAEQQNDQFARRQPGTADWFLQDPRYILWRDKPSATLFCPGIPGSGKSVMLATIVNDLRQHYNHDKDNLAIYFYCNYRRQSEQSITQILASFVRQLFQEKSHVPDVVLEMYQRHSDRGTRPLTDDLLSLINTLLKGYSKVFILVDALDECSDEDGTRSKLISCLFDLQAQVGNVVNLLTTCRPGITKQFSNCPNVEIRAQQQDVERYVKAHITELAPCAYQNTTIQTDIVQGISAVVDGMFLLARLHFMSLKDKTSIRALRQALRDLPKGSKALHIAYDEACNRIDNQLPGFRELARNTLTWITYAREELTIPQLLEALAIRSGMRDIDYEEDLDDAETVIRVCTGLVVVDQASDVVRLVHYTTQTYLEDVRQQWLPNGETFIAQSCITYLSMNTFYESGVTWGMDLDEALRKYKLLAYVSKHWGFHCNDLDDFGDYSNFMNPDSEKLCFIAQVSFSYLYDHYFTYDHKNIPLTHLYARFNNYKALDDLSRCGNEINGEDSHGTTPLHVAALRGYDRFVAQSIRQFNVNVNSQDGNGHTPLFTAVACNNVDVVAALLTRPDIDVNLQARQGSTPLHKASSYGYADIVDALLARPDIDVNSQDKDGWTPLYAASTGRKTDIVAALLTRSDMDVNLQDERGWTPLYTASFYGYTDIVTALLTRLDVDVNLREETGWTPLHAAGLFGRTEVVAALLTRSDIDVNVKIKDGATPLSLASNSNDLDVVATLLVRPDVDVNSPDKDGSTPLHKASRYGYTDIVDALLAKAGIDVNLQDIYGWTPLHKASRYGHSDIVAALLARSDVDIDLRDRDGQTPLDRASAEDHIVIVNALLARSESHDKSRDKKSEMVTGATKEEDS